MEIVKKKNKPNGSVFRRIGRVGCTYAVSNGVGLRYDRADYFVPQTTGYIKLLRNRCGYYLEHSIGVC